MLELLESVLDAPSRMGAPSNDSWCAEVVHTMKTICSLELRQGQPGALSSDHTSGSKVRTQVGKEQMKGHLNTNCIHSLWLWKHSIKVWVTLIIIIKILSHLSGGQNLQVKDFHFCFIYFFLDRGSILGCLFGLWTFFAVSLLYPLIHLCIFIFIMKQGKLWEHEFDLLTSVKILYPKYSQGEMSRSQNFAMHISWYIIQSTVFNESLHGLWHLTQGTSVSPC